jgi:acetyl-CoA synthetase
MSANSLVSEAIARGMVPDTARKVISWIDAGHERNQPQEAWARIFREVLTPAHNFPLHIWLYEKCYGTDSLARSNGPAWLPTSETIDRANVTDVGRRLGLADYQSLHRWSIDNREAYWKLVIERLGIRFGQCYDKIVDTTHSSHPRWLGGSRMNIVDSCFLADENMPAVIESDGSGKLRIWTYCELRQLVARVSTGLIAQGIAPGDAVGIVMPMTGRSVAIYLGIVAVGAVVVSIADSFAPEEIAMRLRLANAKRVFTQDVVHWGIKRLALYEKMVTAGAPNTIVVWANENDSMALRTGDTAFENLLGSDERLTAITREPQDPINVLFSSGTTGEPKAIPWDHTTPIKCGADSHFHQDLHPGDITCWPTNLGWMMGPWLIFSTFLNRATMALYAQAPTDVSFGKFVQDARVTMLGVVPSLVRTWRASDCMLGLDWTKIRAFSSTGECSNPADMLYLMHLAGYRPVIEYCGGTEIGGGYISSTVVQPCVPSTFTTPTLGLDVVLLDENRRPADKGEVFIDGPSIGLSTRLLNRDHDTIYYADTPPGRAGTPLRRHGDELEVLPSGYYRVIGRSDDTMNLGGIKVGCAEIERILNQLPGVQETAAVAVPPPDGGPSRLVIFLVLGNKMSAETYKPILQQAIRTQLNPLFHIEEVCLATLLPRTTSNKLMRRELRAQLARSTEAGETNCLC